MVELKQKGLPQFWVNPAEVMGVEVKIGQTLIYLKGGILRKGDAYEKDEDALTEAKAIVSALEGN